MYRIAIFASGNGTNAQKFFDYFNKHPFIEIGLLLCNKPDAKVLERARMASIETFVFSIQDLNLTPKVFNVLKAKSVDFIVLAGFMLLVPENITREWAKRIVNIHPALLPKYGGKGMYGDNVHKAVLAAGEKVSGISIHYVNSVYDDGDVIFQAECEVFPNDTPDTLSQRIHALEHLHYPLVVEKLLMEKISE